MNGLARAGLFFRRLTSGPIARASGVSLAIRLVGLALSFAQAALTARLLGASGYGTVAVAMSVVGIFATVCQFGLGPLAVREIAARLAIADAGGTRTFIRFATSTVVLLSLAAAAVMAVLGWSTTLLPEHYRTVLGLGALLVLPVALIGLFRGIAQGFGRIALAQIPGELIRPAGLVLVMGAIVLLGLGFGPAGYMFATASVAGLGAAIAWVWLWLGERDRLAVPAGRSEHRRHAAAGLPFLGLALAAMLQGEINTLLLGWLAGPRETGLFQPIARIAPVLTLAVQAAGMGYAPRVAEFWERGEIEHIRAVTATFTWTTTLLTLVAAVTIAAAGPWLMRVFGPEFRESAPLLWYVAAAQLFSAACGPVMMLLLMERRGSGALVVQIGGLTVNGALGVLLIPSHGAEGAVIAMVAGILACSLAMLVTVRARYGFDPSVIGVLLQRSSNAG